MVQSITAGLLLGMLSSFHCVGMCGPLALSLPVQHFSKWGRISSIGFYHAGRIFTYAVFGFVFGLGGRKLYLAGWQQWFSIAAGILMMFIVVEYFIRKNPIQPAFLKYFYQQVQKIMQKYFHSSSPAGFAIFGMANGLLPCGMVYLALAAALSSSQIEHAVGFMIAFGMGTLPAMLALSVIGFKLNLQLRMRIRQMFPGVIAIVGVLLILRGLNLGIPFISPVMEQALGPAVICH